MRGRRALQIALGMAAPTVAWAAVATALFFRLGDFGRYGFWNDEAWVALSSRAPDVAQFWLSLSTTPIGWAASLIPLAHLPLRPEVSLRLLPLAFSVLALWPAHRIGTRLGGPLGGILAAAVLAVDPQSVDYGKVLKQYSAEAFLALLAFDAAAAYARDGRRGDLVRLALSLGPGVVLANTQLFVAPPLVAALALDAVARRDRRRAGTVLAVGAAVTLCDLAVYRFVIAPHLTGSLAAMWADAYVPASPSRAVGFVVARLHEMLRASWGERGLALAVAALPVGIVLARDGRPTAAALALLVVELAAVSARRAFPFGVPRVMLFALTVANVHLAGALGAVLGRAWSSRWLWPVAPAALALLAGDVHAHRAWTWLARAQEVEDLGPLVQHVEADRRPGDVIALYWRSTFVYAYYRPRPVRLVPDPHQAIGYVLAFDDRDLVILYPEFLYAAAERAIVDHQRVWFVGSRLRPGHEAIIGRALLAYGTATVELRRRNAMLVRVERREP